MSIVGNNSNICNGTSVLNDGIIPTLSGVSEDPQSLWATELFTMTRPRVAGRIIVSFEVEPVTHNYVEVVVFNCPDLGINTPLINVYSSNSFRPESGDKILGNLLINYTFIDSSCSDLITYTIEFYEEISERYFNLEFPHVKGSNSSYVFLGEVAFLAKGDIRDTLDSETSKML